jgi:hypothetical protein
MPTALKLEVIMRYTKIRSDREISAMTSLSLSTVKRCMILLTYSKKDQDLMLVEEPKKRMKTDFFIEMYQVLNLIEKNLPNVKKEFNRQKIIDLLLDKYDAGVFTNVVHFRKIADLIRSIKKGISQKQVEIKILHFLRDKKTSLRDILESEDNINTKFSLKKTFEKLADKLNKTEISGIDYDSLIALKKVIDNKIQELRKSRGD